MNGAAPRSYPVCSRRIHSRILALPDRHDQNFNHVRVDPIHNPGAASADAPTPGKLTRQRFSKLVRLSVPDPFLNYFQNDARLGLSDGLEIGNDLVMINNAPDHRSTCSSTPKRASIASWLTALDLSNVDKRSAATAPILRSSSSSINAS